jgi:preprotein translocase subunit SecD
MQGATTKRLESLAADLRSSLREKNIRHGGLTREGQTLRIRFRDSAVRDSARALMLDSFQDLAVAERGEGEELLLVATLKPEAVKRTQEYALQARTSPRCTTGINELGVAPSR